MMVGLKGSNVSMSPEGELVMYQMETSPGVRTWGIVKGGEWLRERERGVERGSRRQQRKS